MKGEARHQQPLDSLLSLVNLTAIINVSKEVATEDVPTTKSNTPVRNSDRHLPSRAAGSRIDGIGQDGHEPNPETVKT